MGLLYASRVEELVREHSPVVAVLVCVLLALLVVRVVARALTRMVLVALLAAVAFFVYAERDEIRTCTVRCECRIAGVDVELPACDPEPLAIR